MADMIFAIEYFVLMVCKNCMANDLQICAKVCVVMLMAVMVIASMQKRLL